MPSIVVNIKNRPIQIVIGIVRHPTTQKILISKRKKEQHLADYWEFPGGKLECGEDYFHALQRELKEEVNLHVIAAHPLKQITHQYDDQIVCLNFWLVTHFSDEAISNENQKIKWIDDNEFTDFQFPEANKSIIDALHLPKHWMITTDCQINKVDEYVSSVKQSMTEYSLKKILFRSKNLDDHDYYHIANKLQKICLKSNCQLVFHRKIINRAFSEDWHITASQLYEFNARPFDNGFLSASCHTIEDIKQAEKIGVNAVFLSSVKKTRSHPEGSTLGWLKFKAISHKTALPLYALGGVSHADLTVAQYHGAIGIAGISTFKVHSGLI